MEGLNKLRNLKQALSTELEKRPIEERQRASSVRRQSVAVLLNAGQKLSLETHACIEILRAGRHLSGGPLVLVDLSNIPDGLNAAETEKFLREHGARP
jgi:hypothetical protein